MSTSQRDTAVIAAGIVVARLARNGPEVLLVHRPLHDDWSYPKGRVDPGESPVDAAQREVREETGLSVRPVHPLPAISYPTRAGIPKTVHWWVGFAARDETVQVDDDEVDAYAWLPLAEAAARCTYGEDFDLTVYSLPTLRKVYGHDAVTTAVVSALPSRPPSRPHPATDPDLARLVSATLRGDAAVSTTTAQRRAG